MHLLIGQLYNLFAMKGDITGYVLYIFLPKGNNRVECLPVCVGHGGDIRIYNVVVVEADQSRISISHAQDVICLRGDTPLSLNILVAGQEQCERDTIVGVQAGRNRLRIFQ